MFQTIYRTGGTDNPRWRAVVTRPTEESARDDMIRAARMGYTGAVVRASDLAAHGLPTTYQLDPVTYPTLATLTYEEGRAALLW